MLDFDNELLAIQILKEYKLIDTANRIILEEINKRKNDKGEIMYGNSQQT